MAEHSFQTTHLMGDVGGAPVKIPRTSERNVGHEVTDVHFRVRQIAIEPNALAVRRTIRAFIKGPLRTCAALELEPIRVERSRSCVPTPQSFGLIRVG